MPAGGPDVRMGGVAWVLTVVYFPVQLVVALAWPGPYSLLDNTISDLGVTHCGPYNPFPSREVRVCSPLHLVMNAGFVIVGTLTALGSVLTWRAWPTGRLTSAALIGAILGGIGGVLVGLAPSDTAPIAHGAGALLQLPAVVAPLLFGIAIHQWRPVLAASSVVIGIVGIAGTVLFALRFPPQAFGLLERLALDPFTIWTCLLGITVCRSVQPPAANGTMPA
ncbi:putative membrane protein [Kribbella aluminosa]|uniref:Membrane protein n=1 Tax=Kribbella aluminosa TaxID=416017 RepID=A0ABS4UTP1_9ACTN|nr:DUF998 domain-containing protein [Kribbella aluminosa]MBP2354926.1 putative membrane protein [Kribbella aluminosa]